MRVLKILVFAFLFLAPFACGDDDDGPAQDAAVDTVQDGGAMN